MKRIALLVLMGISILGCGSDESRPGIKPSIPSLPTGSNGDIIEKKYELLSGIYEGITGQGEIAEGLVDDNKRMWVIYSNNNSDRDVLGFVNTNENIVGNNGEFSVEGKNYSYDSRSAFDITISGNYKTAESIRGEIFDLPSRATTYEIDYNQTLSDKKQTLTDIGNKIFTGIAYITGDTEAGILSIQVDQDGNFTGEDQSGCQMSGKFIPSASQRYFESTVTFGGSLCYAFGEKVTGVALINEDYELIVLGTDANKTKGIYFAGE